MPVRATRTQPVSPPVGVMAASQSIANSIARELGIKNAVALSPKSDAARGMQLKALLVDESCWPLSAYTQAGVIPALKEHGAYIVRLTRYDPNKGNLNVR